jgi:hypothetical protein
MIGGRCNPRARCCDVLEVLIRRNRTKGSKISGNASNQAEPMALLPCWVFACGYKMAQESQEQSWPIKYH